MPTTTASATFRACCKLDYIADLASIRLICLLSESRRDDGYDISDYRACIRITAMADVRGS